VIFGWYRSSCLSWVYTGAYFLFTDTALGARIGGCVALCTGEAEFVGGGKVYFMSCFYLGTYFIYVSIVEGGLDNLMVRIKDSADFRMHVVFLVQSILHIVV